MIVMGGIIGSGIFINPYVVAQQVPSAGLILAAWAVGGMIALAGAFIYAELASQSFVSGGQYIYLREAFHPALAFTYGWSLLLVTQSGGMAVVAVTFAKYICALGNAEMNEWMITLIAALALASLTVTNCLGVRAGSSDAEFLYGFEVDRDRSPDCHRSDCERRTEPRASNVTFTSGIH